ncbi:TetR/AcrR family transcriptional regulator [Microbacterium lacus]|uniref:TetR/AcrR family transcriptional regulator n=1 Tax=Microbacterium lacus TaxID=415217 RepID=A0ABP4TE71_9MICO
MTEPAGRARRSTGQRILSDAASLFRRHGYEATTTREISEALGIKKATLYHHVSSKEDLLYRICLAALHDVEVNAKAAVEQAEARPRERIRAMIHGHTVAMLAEVDFSHTMLTDMRSLSGDRLNEVVQLRDSYQNWTESLVREAQESGDLREDVPAPHLTLALFNLLNWTMFWYRADGDLAPSQVSELLTTMFLDGASHR